MASCKYSWNMVDANNWQNISRDANAWITLRCESQHDLLKLMAVVAWGDAEFCKSSLPTKQPEQIEPYTYATLAYWNPSRKAYYHVPNNKWIGFLPRKRWTEFVQEMQDASAGDWIGLHKWAAQLIKLWGEDAIRAKPSPLGDYAVTTPKWASFEKNEVRISMPLTWSDLANRQCLEFPVKKDCLAYLQGFITDFKSPNFAPLVERPSLRSVGWIETTRHESLISFLVELGRNSTLFPKSMYESETRWKWAHETLFRECLDSPALLAVHSQNTLRWQLTHCHYDKWFTPENVNALFEGSYLNELLTQLLQTSNAQHFDKQLCENAEQERLSLNHDSDKGIGFIAREEGRFGSTCLRENVGEESSPEEHDNDWVDQMSFEYGRDD